MTWKNVFTCLNISLSTVFHFLLFVKLRLLRQKYFSLFYLGGESHEKKINKRKTKEPYRSSWFFFHQHLFVQFLKETVLPVSQFSLNFFVFAFSLVAVAVIAAVAVIVFFSLFKSLVVR